MKLLLMVQNFGRYVLDLLICLEKTFVSPTSRLQNYLERFATSVFPY